MASARAAVLLGVLVTILHTGPSAQQMQTIPEAVLQGLTQFGATSLGAEIQKLQKAYNASVLAFIPVNKTCNGVIEKKIEACRTCITNSCKQRAQKVCKPAEWQVILAKGIQFFSKGIPTFFSKTVKGIFVDKLGKAVVNVGGQIGDFFAGSIPNGIIDAGKTIGNGVVDIGKELGHVGEKIGGSVVDIGKQIGKVGEEIGSGFVKLGNGAVHLGKDIFGGISSVIGKIGSIFGRRRSVVGEFFLRRAASEPGCDAIKNDASTACGYYVNTCKMCKIDPKVDCRGFKAAVDKVMAADKARAWLAKATNSQYQVASVKVDAASFDPATTGYKKVEVTVRFLGNTLTFSMRHPVNPYNPVAAGPAIMRQAIDVVKAL